MLDTLVTKKLSTFGELLRSLQEAQKSQAVMVNGGHLETMFDQIDLISQRFGEAELQLTHTVSEEAVEFQRWQIRSNGFEWAIGCLTDANTAQTFVQMPLDLILKAANGQAPDPGRPDGSLASPFAAVGIKTAARLLRPPKSLAEMKLPERNREVVRLYIEEFKNKQNFAIFPRLFKADFTHHFDHDGLDGNMKSWVMTGQDFLRGFPDVQVTIKHLVADEDYVLEHNLAIGQHEGLFRGTKPTGRKTEWPEMHLYRLQDGKIAENWPLVSFGQIVDQLV